MEDEPTNTERKENYEDPDQGSFLISLSYEIVKSKKALI